jgi:hypothetical protein
MDAGACMLFVRLVVEQEARRVEEHLRLSADAQQRSESLPAGSLFQRYWRNVADYHRSIAELAAARAMQFAQQVHA